MEYTDLQNTVLAVLYSLLFFMLIYYTSVVKGVEFKDLFLSHQNYCAFVSLVQEV